MTDVEDKIRKLLELASHPNTPVDEARTAGYQAAKLMREHNVAIGTVSGPAPKDFGISDFFGGFDPRRSPLDRGTMIRGAALNLFFEFMQVAIARARENRPAPPHPAPPSPPPRPAPTDDGFFPPDFFNEWAKQQAKPKRRRKRSKQSRKNNPNRERRRKT